MKPTENPAIVPYPPVERHGIVGDRRTAALISADGTAVWLCLPDFDGSIIFGALLDGFKGGYWKLGPKARVLGQQSYFKETAVLETRWQFPSGALVLRDVMVDRPVARNSAPKPRHLLLRCLECVRGNVQCSFDLQPGYNFKRNQVRVQRNSLGYSVHAGSSQFQIWTNRRTDGHHGRILLDFVLRSGQKLWAVLDYGGAGTRWTAAKARTAFEESKYDIHAPVMERFNQHIRRCFRHTGSFSDSRRDQ